MHTRHIVPVLLLGVSTAVSASFESELSVIGFSARGSYLAYQVTIPYSESGYAFSSVYVVDVDQNEQVGPLITRRSEGELTEDELTAAVRIDASAMLRRYAIVDGNAGEQAYVNEDAETWDEIRQQSKVSVFPVELEGGRRTNLEIRLYQRDMESDLCPRLGDYDLKPRIFSLTIGLLGKSYVLHSDSELDRSRNCPYAYTVSSVYLYGDKIAVFLDARTVGFEGDDIYTIAITGMLPAP